MARENRARNLLINWAMFLHRILRGAGDGTRTRDNPLGRQGTAFRLLNKLTVPELAELSKSYISQVKHGKLGIDKRGIQTMPRRLEKATGLPCNPHTFRRTFACLLRRAGIDTMTIKDLGRWESLEMVQRYTRSVSFQDSLRFYKAKHVWLRVKQHEILAE